MAFSKRVREKVYQKYNGHCLAKKYGFVAENEADSVTFYYERRRDDNGDK